MRLTVCLGLALLQCAPVARAQPLGPSPRLISLDECIQLALRHNLDLQIERLGPELARYDLGHSYADYDPIFSFTGREDFQKRPAELDPKKSGLDFPFELTTDTFGFGLHGLLPTGLTYDLQAQSDSLTGRTDFSLNPADALRFPPTGIRFTNEYAAFAGMTVRQPLLKNFWIDSTRQRIWIDRKNLKISELALRRQIMNVITRVELGYYELGFAREEIHVQEKALELAQALVHDTHARVRAGDLPPLDEKQAESQVETTQANLFAAEQAMTEQQVTMKNLLTDDFKQWADVQLEPDRALDAPVLVLDRMESWKEAFAHRPDLVQFKTELEKHDIILRYQRNQLFPSLDLVGSYGARGVRGAFKSAADDVGALTNPAYSYGVILSFPIANQGARQSYKAAQTMKKEAMLQLKKLEQDIMVQVELAIAAAQTAFKRLGATRQARVYAEAALEAEQKKLASGLSTAYMVLQFQERTTAARTTEARALADYKKSLVQLAFAEGTTLDRNHLVLEAR